MEVSHYKLSVVFLLEKRKASSCSQAEGPEGDPWFPKAWADIATTRKRKKSVKSELFQQFSQLLGGGE